MTLLDCTELWGTATIVHSDPVIEHCRDLVYLPFSPDGWFDLDPSWGVYTAAGPLLEAAACIRNYQLAGQSPQAPFDLDSVTDFAPEEEYIYGGPLILHYGHFLVSTLSRLWFLARSGRLQNRKILFHAGSIERALAIPFISEIFKGLGLAPSQIVSFATPVRLPHLIVPRHGFGEQMFAHKAYFRLCQLIGKTLLGPDWTVPWDDTPVYLSRSALTNATGRVIDEEVIEAELAESGVRIVHPEKLPLREQIALFATHRIILGMAGSAFHSCVFAPAANVLIPVFPTGIMNANFALIDGLRGLQSRCVHPSGAVRVDQQDKRFIHNWTFESPADLARDLLDLANTARQDVA